MIDEKFFYYQLAKSIQTWLSVEVEIYSLYAMLMKGANSHLVSVTFHHIESFEKKLQLLNSCFSLAFSRDSSEWKKWKSLYNKAQGLNDKRNKIVHQPVSTGMNKGVEFICIKPSLFNALALVKGQTSYNGPVIGEDYKPSSAKLLDDHKIDQSKLFTIEKEFKKLSEDLREYRDTIRPVLERTFDKEKKQDSRADKHDELEKVE